MKERLIQLLGFGGELAGDLHFDARLAQLSKAIAPHLRVRIFRCRHYAGGIVEHASAIRRQLVDGRLFVVPDCGHEVMSRKPGLFNEALAAFFRTTETVATARAERHATAPHADDDPDRGRWTEFPHDPQ